MPAARAQIATATCCLGMLLAYERAMGDIRPDVGVSDTRHLADARAAGVTGSSRHRPRQREGFSSAPSATHEQIH